MPSCFRAEEWQCEASEQLQRLLTVTTLRRLVGNFERSLRADRRAESGVDRPSQRHELADALLIAHDVDLLAHREVRDALAKAAQTVSGSIIESPKRWVAGQAAAHQFVSAMGLPLELVGVRSAERPNAFIRVSPPFPYRQLKPYQVEMSEAMYRRMNSPAPDNRAMISLPTGAGKTRVAVETLHRWAHDLLEKGALTQVVFVWLAHTEELCEQAVECFEDVWRSNPNGTLMLGMGRFWGSYRSSIDLGSFFGDSSTDMRIFTLISTPQSFVRESLSGYPAVNAVVIDEAHRAASATYRKIIERRGEEACIIGLTATPFRREFDRRAPLAGTEALLALFRHLELPASLGNDAPSRLKTLQKMGVLSYPIIRTVQTRLTLSVDVPPPMGDDINLVFNFDQELQLAADQTRRRRVVINTLLEVLDETPSARVLYFGPSVQDAESVAFMLRVKGKRAAAVSGNTRTATRRGIIADFRAGRIDILCNCEVLTAGFDAPTVSHVVMARPTISQVLYEQMVGRGLRGPEFGGTKQCWIIDFEDRYRRHRPQLGYEQFRQIWHPEVELASTGSDRLGLLVQLGSGPPQSCFHRGGRAEASSKAMTKAVPLPLLVRLEGPGSAKLTIEVLDTKSDRRSFHRLIELGEKHNSVTLTVPIPERHKLRMESITSDLRAYVEVRRNNRSAFPLNPA